MAGHPRLNPKNDLLEPRSIQIKYNLNFILDNNARLYSIGVAAVKRENHYTVHSGHGPGGMFLCSVGQVITNVI